ncbi:FUSC family protein [Microbacterium sp. p3-SID336]|uniref:FUSC family protein n=1 Tax=Microbacterium sp. p3-SID336 TaxID=2916212 RepID=UPI0021A8E057|nr:FUSC family protein [Microbacterium sp. p3-SID336]MCT1479207.1 FUSC family protein [Microbacterium sp. p3-SID336]
MATSAPLRWQWSRFGLGLLYAVPSLLVAPADPRLALALSIGVLPAAAIGLPPRRRARAAIPLIGVLTAVGLLLGSALALVPVVAVPAIGALSVLCCLAAARSRAGHAALILVLPMVGIGLSFPLSAASGWLAAFVVVGSVYAWLVSLLWPERNTRPVPLPAVPRGRAMVLYGFLLGIAAATAATIGFATGLKHVGWATAAVLLVMRPVRGQVVARSFGRAGAVLVGALAAAGVAALAPGGWGAGVAIAAAVACLCAVNESRWYVAPAFSTFLVLTLLLCTSEVAPAERFLERTLETLLGVGLALVFGALVPALLGMRGRSRQAREMVSTSV